MNREPITYIERVPRCGKLEECPILLLLHGWAMYKEHLFEMTKNFDPRWRIISLGAPVRMGPGAYRWFDFERTPDIGPIIDDKEEQESLAQLVEIIEQFACQSPLGKVNLLAHSQGGSMSLSATLQNPHLIASCADVNGRVLNKVKEAVKGSDVLSGISFFHGHGTNNSIVPISIGRQSVEYISQLGGDISSKEYPIDHEITEKSLSDIASWHVEIIARQISNI